MLDSSELFLYFKLIAIELYKMGVTEFVLECTYSYKYGCFYYTIRLLWWLIGRKSLTYMYREALKIEA